MNLETITYKNYTIAINYDETIQGNGPDTRRYVSVKASALHE